MYTMLDCQVPFGEQPALLTYIPDIMSDGSLRRWKSGKPFNEAPPRPIALSIDVGESGTIKELYDATIAVMSRRLAGAILACGVSNIEFYETVIHDIETGARHTTHLAFNIVGAVAAADLDHSKFAAHGASMIAIDFDSLAIDESKTRGADLFRLAESVNGIVVSDRVKCAIAKAGIETVSFLPPASWVG